VNAPFCMANALGFALRCGARERIWSNLQFTLSGKNAKEWILQWAQML